MRKNAGISPLLFDSIRKSLPIQVVLAGLLCPVVWSEPDAGFVGVQGTKENRLQHRVRYLLSDPAFLEGQVNLDSLRQEKVLRPIEPIRTLREILPDGRLVLRGGRSVTLRGVVFAASKTLADIPHFKTFQKSLKGKQVRLLFERETHDSKGCLNAYLYLKDLTLLNEEVLRLGFGHLDTTASLSPQYRHRLRKAEEFARNNRVGIWAKETSKNKDAHQEPPDSKLSNPRRGLLGNSGWTSTFDREKRPR